jgi:hypothetical protein
MEASPAFQPDSESGVVLVEYAVLFAMVIVFFGIMVNGLFERDNNGNLVVTERIILARGSVSERTQTFHFHEAGDGDPMSSGGTVWIPNPLYGFTSYFQRITDFLALPIP